MKPLNCNFENLLRLTACVTIAAFIASSCQKVINLKLSTASPLVVISGYVSDQPGVDTVKITKSGSYFNPGNYPVITDAKVIITDNAGPSDTLVQVDSGVYAATPNFAGVPGHTYTMRAIIGSKEYDAASTMPAPVNIDSVSIYPLSTIDTINGVADTVNHVRCYFKDPPSIGHYYLLQAIINGVLQDSIDEINIVSDEFEAGTEIDKRLSGADPFQGQTVKVNLMCIDAGTYNFYNVVKSIASEGNPVSTSVPQNPPSNIVGGALGYFTAFPIRSVTQVVQ